MSTNTEQSRSTDTLLRLVNDIHLAFARLFNHQATAHGLTRAHWRVIAGLYRHNGLTQTELAGTIAMARSPLGKVVDRLETAGLIERQPDPDDRRVNRLRLTEKAVPLIEPAQRLVAQLEARAFADVPEKDRDTLVANLVSVRDALNDELDQETVSWDTTVQTDTQKD